jgi:methylglyoxal synthase
MVSEFACAWRSSLLGFKIARKGGERSARWRGGMITTDDVAAAFFFIDPLSAHPMCVCTM